MKPSHYVVVVIGGGISGLITSITAIKNHANKVLLVERENEFGGLVSYLSGYIKIGAKLDAADFIKSLIEEASALGVKLLTDTTIIEISPKHKLLLLNKTFGIMEAYANTMVFATGRYQGPQARLNIGGNRPAGVYSAQLVLKWLRKGLSPGTRFIVYGDHILGLVAADQIIKSGGTLVKYLSENPTTKFGKEILSNCDARIRDRIEPGIRIKRIIGNRRLTSIETFSVYEQSDDTSKAGGIIPCDTLVLASEFVIDKDFLYTNNIPAKIDSASGGLAVDNYFRTTYPGMFAVGSVVRITDSIEESIREAQLAGSYCSLQSKGLLEWIL